MSAPGTPYIPGTPFIPPLTSASNSPNPEPSPVIPGPGGISYQPHASPLVMNYPPYGAGYPQYQSSPFTNTTPFIPPSPNAQPPPVIPHPPPPPVSRGHSRQGLSADYTGYPPGSNPFGPASPQHIPPQAQYTPFIPPSMMQTPYTPQSAGFSPYPQAYSAPPVYGGYPMNGTPWPAQAGPLPSPHGPPSARGLPGQGFMAPPMGAFTPGYMSGGLPPGGGGPWNGQPQGQYYPPDAAWHGFGAQNQNQRVVEPPAQVYDRMDPFTPGTHYHPVLDPFLIKVVNAKVRLNPLISTLPEDGSDQVHLNWNMLFPTAYVHRSDTPRHLSWSAGREAPATYPRTTSMRLVSEAFPWMVVVHAKDKDRGVTCGEVIEAIGYDMSKMSNKKDYENFSPKERAEVTTAYRMNRSRNEGAPGGQLGEGLKHLDFLRKNTMFAGLEVNDRLVAKLCGDVLPCVFVLRCSRTYQMTKQEIKDNEMRARAATQNSSRSRANSNAERISVHPPSTSAESDGEDDYHRI